MGGISRRELDQELVPSGPQGDRGGFSSPVEFLVHDRHQFLDVVPRVGHEPAGARSLPCGRGNRSVVQEDRAAVRVPRPDAGDASIEPVRPCRGVEADLCAEFVAPGGIDIREEVSDPGGRPCLAPRRGVGEHRNHEVHRHDTPVHGLPRQRRATGRVTLLDAAERPRCASWERPDCAPDHVPRLDERERLGTEESVAMERQARFERRELPAEGGGGRRQRNRRRWLSLLPPAP